MATTHSHPEADSPLPAGAADTDQRDDAPTHTDSLDVVLDLSALEGMTAPGRDLLLRLTAANAALDPTRHRWRRDIHMSAVLEVLGSVDSPMTEQEIVREARRAWATDAISEVSITEAITLANRSGFISEVRNFDEVEAWQLSSATREEVKRDQHWAAEVFREFQTQLRVRLSEIEDIDDSRIPRLSEQLLMACVVATNGVYEVARYADRLGPLELDLRSMTQHLKTEVQPRSVFEAMVRMAEAVADPDDPFGNEILHLLVTGNILHGLMSHQDLAHSSGIEGYRIVVDTSTLVYGLDPESNEGRIFDLLISETLAAGAEIVVPEHVLEEWDAVWAEADAKLRNLDSESIRLIAEGHILVNNPVANAFAVCAQRDPGLNWFRYTAKRRPIKDLLASRGVTIRRHGNGEDDADLVERVSLYLQKPRVRPYPTATKAIRDANSCAMVARWRNADNLDPPQAWFVAQDRATARAYAKECPEDPYPLTVTPESWLMFMSVMAPPVETDIADRINAIGDAVRRSSFLSVASGYPIDDALRMMSILQERDNGALTPEELRRSVQVDLVSLLEHADQTREDPIPVAVELAQRRLKRRNHQADRDKIETLQEDDRLRRDREAFEGDKDRILQERNDAVRRADEADKRLKRRRHRSAVLLAYVALAALGGFSLGWSTLREPYWVPTIILSAGFFALWLKANDYVRNIKIPARAYLSTLAIGALTESILLAAAIYATYALA